MAVMAEEDWRECTLYKVRPWSPRIPQVVPGRDYVGIPANADETPAWTVLVGVVSASALRLHRFRVARSGRISGRSDGALQIFHDLRKRPGCSWSADAALAPDGRSLCVIEQAENEPTQALQLQLQTDHGKTKQTLPPLDPSSVRGRCMPISADGHLWAVSAFASSATSFGLVLQRLVIQKEDGEDAAGRSPSPSRWEQVGDPYVHPSLPERRWAGGFLQGYAVLPGRGADGGTLILLSLDNALFFTLDLSAPDSGWTQVLTDDPSHQVYFYIPIIGRGIYVQENNAIYVLHAYTIYAYNLSLENQEEDHDGPKRTTRLKLKPPLPVDTASPSIGGNGHSFLAHLGGRLMCSVWISVRLRCPCDHLHAIVTTFYLLPSDIGGVEVVHATCRRLHLLPLEHGHQHEFSFLQEYKHEKVLLQHGVEDDPIPIPASPEMLDVISFDTLIQKGLAITSLPCPAVREKPAAIHKDLFVICQAGLQSFIYKLDKFNVTDWSAIERARLGRRLARHDDGRPPLEPHYVVRAHEGHHHMLNEEPPPRWHFVRGSTSELYAVSCIDTGMRVVDLDKRSHTFAPRLVDPFVMAIRVGGVTVALTDTLQVYKLKAPHPGSTSWSWVRWEADHSHVLDRKIKLSGYATVGDDSFLVSDVIACSCLLFDMGAKRWRVVMPWVDLSGKHIHLPRTMQRNHLLNGRCVFVEGFIYTCVKDGLAAYELLWEDHHSVYLSDPIRLSWGGSGYWWRGFMCLDYVGINTDSGAILFCVVQGEKNILRIATVQVKTEKTPREKKMKPVGIHQVVCVTTSIYRGERTAYEKQLCSGPYLFPYYTDIFSCASE